MLELPDEVKTAFDNGQFSVRQTTGRFNGICSDMGTEKTIIRDAKGDSGIVGLTRKKPALVRWTLTRHLLSAYAKSMKERSGVGSKSQPPIHEQLSPASMARDKKHVQTLVDHMAKNMTNPFDVEGHPEDVLINISYGLYANADVRKSLLNAVDNGQKQCERFVQISLSSASESSLYTAIPKSGLLTFSDMAKKTKLTCKGEAIQVQMNS